MFFVWTPKKKNDLIDITFHMYKKIFSFVNVQPNCSTETSEEEMKIKPLIPDKPAKNK